MAINKKSVGYARVATAEAEDKLQLQVCKLQASGASEIFAEIASGVSNSRSELDKLIALIQTGQVSQVVVTRFDRLTRSLEQYNHLKQLFQTHGVTLYILD